MGVADILRAEAEIMLQDTLIPFWSALRDDEFGGYYGLVDYDLSVDAFSEKGGILNSRILWFFSSVGKLEEARHAYAFLMARFWDSEYGGVFWSVDHKGKPLDDSKHTYAQAFALYGLAAYYQASGEKAALETAQTLYRLIEEKCTNQNGYMEAFNRQFRPVSNEKLSENEIMAAKTMNTLLHVFEAYSALYQAAPDSDLECSMRRILDIFENSVYNPGACRLDVFFDGEMKPLIDLQSYGHDIEAAWLLDWGTGLLGDDALRERIGKITSALANSVRERAYHDHSLWNECENGVADENRIWWVQAEAVVGFLNAGMVDTALDIWRYIKDFLVDRRENSEWFWQVDPDGKPAEKPIVEPWKCPYHNGRMCLEIIRRVGDGL